MNYGKTAYLKVLDLEKKVTNNTASSQDGSSYMELTKPNFNQTLTNDVDIIAEFPKFYVNANQNICFQIKSTITSLSGGTARVELLIDGLAVYEESKQLLNEENDIILLKTFTPITTGEITLSLRFYSDDDQFNATIKNITIVVLGASGENTSSDLELRAIKLEPSGKALISYIDGGKLYYCVSELSSKTLRLEDFTCLSTAISHCFSQDSFYSEDNPSPSVVLYRVDGSGNLYMSKPLEAGTEKMIESNVSVVYACPCPNVSDDTNIITYIKNDGLCYFRTLRKDSLVSEKKLALPAGTYTDIRVVSKEDSDYVYLIASHSNGSNYIIRSLIEVSTGKIVEMLEADYLFVVSKYIDLSFLTQKATEHIYLSSEMTLSSIFYYDEAFERVSNSHLCMDYDLQSSTYKYIPPITYGIKLNKNILVAEEWGSYTDDAVGFEGAYMDFDNDVFVDNGWLNRWPFDSIRPCLLKDGKVVGYLNPNDYTEFEDGTPAGITSASNGNVMIEIPKMYYKLSRDDDYIYIQVSNTARSGFTCSPFVYKGQELSRIYVSAYFTGTTRYKTEGFKSISGQRVNYAYAFGYEFCYPFIRSLEIDRTEIISFGLVTLLQSLFAIMFKNTNSQAILGLGYGSYSMYYYTGVLDKKGMYYGTKTNEGIKVFGIEDFYGVRRSIAIGYYLDADYYPHYIDPYNEEMSYEPDYISNYIKAETPLTKPSMENYYTSDISGVNEYGFIGRAFSTTPTNGFCDASNQRTNSNCASFGMTYTGNFYGIYNVETLYNNFKSSEVGVRLIYYPNETTGEN